MATEWITLINLKTPFARGLIADKGIHLVPESFCVNCKNIRTINGTTTMRKGYQKISNWPEGVKSKIQGLVAIKGELYTICKGVFYKVNLWTGKLEKKDWTTFSDSKQTNFVVYNDFIFCLDGENFPKIFDKKTGTFTVLDTAKIPSGANPRFWTVFSANVYLVWGGENKNMLYISKGITKNTPTDSYDFVGTGSENLFFHSDIEAISSNKGKVYIFTANTIEVLTKDTVTVGTVTSRYSTPIAGENRVASSRSVVIADDRIFFFAKGNKVRTLEFIPWVTDISVGDLSDRAGQSIQRFLDSLDDDQSSCFWYYNKEKKQVYFHLKERGENFNNVVLVYDVINDNFLIDTNKYFSDIVKCDGKYYAGSDTNGEIYLDDTGNMDNGQPIRRERRNAPLSFGNPNIRKEFREVNIYGEIEDGTSIDVEVFVEWSSRFKGKIKGANAEMAGTGSEPLAWNPYNAEFSKNWLLPFEYWITAGNLRARGKKIELVFSWEWPWDFCLSGGSIGLIGLWDREISDKGKNESNNAKIEKNLHHNP